MSIVKLVSYLYGTGVGRLPFVYKAYQSLMPLVMGRRKITVQLGGFKMLVDTGKYLNSNATQILFNQTHEPLTSEIFRLLLKAGDRVIDVGANIGYFTMLAASVVGKSGRVYAFEPGIEAYSDLRENIATNGFTNIDALNMAAGSKRGQTVFYTSRENTTNSLIRDDRHTEATHVQVDTLDRLIASPVNLIKIDVENNELDVLRGAYHLIKGSPDIAVVLEIGPNVKSNYPLLLDTWYYLKTLNLTTLFVINEFNGKIYQAHSVADISCGFDRKNMYLNLLCLKGG
jgi:FkbM family methyltransferase